MIKRFLPNETVFEHNKYVLKPRDVKVVEEANGIFELEIELPKTTVINKRDIVTAPTHMGVQPFRVYRITKTLYGKKAFARHIFYDLADALLLDSRPTSATCNDALQTIINATGYTGWSYLSDIADLRTAYYIRKNPVEAIIGADNSVLNVWGGYLVRDNKEIRIMQSGVDRNYQIRLGKNLIGIEDDSDDSNVVTRLYPTYEKDQVIYDLPEKYIDSPLMANYPNPIVKEIRVALTDDEKEFSDEQIYTILRNYCSNLYSVDNVDKPIANYKIDFVELSKIAQLPQYRQYTYAGLEQMTYETIQTLTYAELQSTTVIESFVGLFEKVEMHDIVTINVSELDIDLKAQVIKVEYDSLGDRYTKIELGGFKPSNKYQINNIVKQLQIDKDKATDEYKALYDLAINKVTGNKGGYQVTRFNASNEPYETLWMDTPDVTTAVNVLRINQNGIAGSNNGINGEYKLAITTDGWIVAERILANQLSAISANLGTVTTGRMRSPDGTLDINLNDKTFLVGNENESVNTGIKYDGLQIRDGEDVIAAFGESGANIKKLQTDVLISPKVMQYTTPGTYTVGFDESSTFGSVQEAFDRLFIDGRRFLNDQLLLLVYGDHYGDVDIKDIYGGSVIIRLMDGAKFYGTINGINLYTSFKIEKSGTGRGFVDGGSNYPFNFNRCFNVMVEGINWAGNTVGLYARASNVIIRDCDLGTNNFYYGYIAEQGSVITAINNRGRATGNRAETRNGTIYQQGEVPGSPLGDSNKGGNIINTSIVETSSSYDIPPVTNKTFVRLFTNADFDTLSNGGTYVSSYYGPTAAQNRWPGNPTWSLGRIRMGREIKDFIAGGTGISIRMRLHRADTSHGYPSSAIPPTPNNFSCSMTGAIRNGWTGWGAIDKSYFGDTVDLRLGSNAYSNYAIWDAIDVEVTVTKNI